GGVEGMQPDVVGGLVQHVHGVAGHGGGEAFQVVGRRAVAAVDLVPAAAAVGGLHHHQDVAGFGGFDDEVQVAVRRLPRADRPGRLDEGAAQVPVGHRHGQHGRHRV